MISRTILIQKQRIILNKNYFLIQNMIKLVIVVKSKSLNTNYKFAWYWLNLKRKNSGLKFNTEILIFLLNVFL